MNVLGIKRKFYFYLSNNVLDNFKVNQQNIGVFTPSNSDPTFFFFYETITSPRQGIDELVLIKMWKEGATTEVAIENENTKVTKPSPDEVEQAVV